MEKSDKDMYEKMYLHTREPITNVDLCYMRSTIEAIYLMSLVLRNVRRTEAQKGSFLQAFCMQGTQFY